MPAFRLFAFVLALTPLGLLAVTRSLKPSNAGLGTHQQLGLPPCTMRVLLGIRCPGCGMTTSWAHFTRGQWAQSVRSNTGGFLLACLALVCAPILLRAALRSQFPSRRCQDWMIYGVLAVTAVTFIDWGTRLMKAW